MKARDLARLVHADGFVTLPYASYGSSLSVIQKLRTQVLYQFSIYLSEAATQNLDLTLREHAERLPGFYVREGGRIDMQLSSLAIGTNFLMKYSTQSSSLVDMILLKDMAICWQPYIGCVVSQPGDEAQNWHLDGIHRNKTIQESVDRLNVFVPLVALNDEIGGTEMKLRSHIHENGARGTAFEDYQDLPSVIAHIQAGTPIIMDYRVWHRGLANTSKDTLRPLLYFKYAKIETNSDLNIAKKRKRITPVQV
ncbi:putative phytanoyl-CoA dioxygenase [Plasmopara halstedii]